MSGQANYACAIHRKSAVMIAFIYSHSEAGHEQNDHHPEKKTEPVNGIRVPDRKILNGESGRNLRRKEHETYESHYSDAKK